MALRYHPDKNANDPKAADMFKEVTFSYTILSDPDKRRQYDAAGFEIEILEMDTYRYHGHSMSDPGSTYRTRDEITGVRQERDPLERIRKLILSHDLATEKELKDTEKEIRKEVDDAIAKAKESPLPDSSELFTNIYVKGYGAQSYGADRKELRATLP